MARCASDRCSRWRPDLLAGVTGITIDARWFCSDSCVQQMVQRMLAESAPVAPQPAVASASHLRLGVLLRHHRALSADQLHECLEQQRASGLRLGAQARALFGIDPALVLRALAAQAGTRYLTAIDPATVHDAPGGLSRATIKALGLIPFSHPDKERVVRVASTAPLHWEALNALRRFAGWVPEPYLVEDGTWDDLLEQYGAGLGPDTAELPCEALVVKTEREAIERITSLAASARRARIAQAHWAPYTLVRVQGDASVKDVLFTRPVLEDPSWQAASTLH